MATEKSGFSWIQLVLWVELGWMPGTNPCLSLPSSGGQGRENITKDLWDKKSREQSLISYCHRLNRLDLGKLIYYQSNQRREMRNRNKPLIPPVFQVWLCYLYNIQGKKKKSVKMNFSTYISFKTQKIDQLVCSFWEVERDLKVWFQWVSKSLFI